VVARYGAQLAGSTDTVAPALEPLAFVLNAMLFILVGAALPAWTLLPVAGLVLAAFVIICLTRAVPSTRYWPRSNSGPFHPMAMAPPSRSGQACEAALSVALALSVRASTTSTADFSHPVWRGAPFTPGAGSVAHADHARSSHGAT